MERERIVAATRAGGSDIHKRRRERGDASRGTRKKKKRRKKERKNSGGGSVYCGRVLLTVSECHGVGGEMAVTQPAAGQRTVPQL